MKCGDSKGITFRYVPLPWEFKCLYTTAMQLTSCMCVHKSTDTDRAANHVYGYFVV